MNNNPNTPQEGAEGAKAADADKKREGTSASTAGQSKRGQEREDVSFLRVDHTPPPLLIREGSLIIETDLPFHTVDNMGGADHPRRHSFLTARPIKGLKIVDDAGDTLYLNAAADGCSVKIWWNRAQAAEQVFINGSDFSVSTIGNLGTGTDLGSGVPLGNPVRFRRYTHPDAGAMRVQQVEIIKDGRTRYFEDSNRIYQVMVWFTS
jgi:hypothetical protein